MGKGLIMNKDRRLSIFILSGIIFSSMHAMISQDSSDLTAAITRLEALNLAGSAEIVTSLKSIAQAIKGSDQEVGLVTVQDIEQVKGPALRFLSSTRYTSWTELQERLYALDLALKDFKAKYNDKLTAAVQGGEALSLQQETDTVSVPMNMSESDKTEESAKKDADLSSEDGSADLIEKIEPMEVAALPTTTDDAMKLPSAELSIAEPSVNDTTELVTAVTITKEAAPVVAEQSVAAPEVESKVKMPEVATSVVAVEEVPSVMPTLKIEPAVTEVTEVVVEQSPKEVLESSSVSVESTAVEEDLDDQEGLGLPDMPEDDSI